MRGPRVKYKQALNKSGSIRVRCCMPQENLEEGSNEEKDEEVMAEKDVQVVVEEKLEEINLRSDSQEPRPISISLRLSEKEKLELILLLKEYKNVLA